MVLEIKDQKTFETSIESTKLSVVHFQADWVEQCAQINELLETLASQEDFSEASFYSCAAEDLSEISNKYKIVAVPTVLFFRSGKVIDKVLGVNASKVTETVKKHISINEDDTGSFEDRLKSLINKSNVMLFMKGDRITPRCGFSRQIVEIINNTGVKYETFDILTDEDVREGLKEYSDWPTYPQLYVKGELIGGLDIVKEMVASGDFESTLKA